MNISNRLKRVISDKGWSVYQFEKSIGASNGYVHHLKNNIRFDKLYKILELFPKSLHPAKTITPKRMVFKI